MQNRLLHASIDKMNYQKALKKNLPHYDKKSTLPDFGKNKYPLSFLISSIDRIDSLELCRCSSSLYGEDENWKNNYSNLIPGYSELSSKDKKKPPSKITRDSPIILPTSNKSETLSSLETPSRSINMSYNICDMKYSNPSSSFLKSILRLNCDEIYTSPPPGLENSETTSNNPADVNENKLWPESLPKIESVTVTEILNDDSVNKKLIEEKMITTMLSNENSTFKSNSRITNHSLNTTAKKRVQPTRILKRPLKAEFNPNFFSTPKQFQSPDPSEIPLPPHEWYASWNSIQF